MRFVILLASIFLLIEGCSRPSSMRVLTLDVDAASTPSPPPQYQEREVREVFGNVDIGPSIRTELDLSKVESVTRLQAYLSNYGYLKPSAANLGVFDKKTSDAVKLYQRFFSLPITGELDPKTLDMIVTDRCGNPDRFIEAATKCPWQKPQMQYFFQNFSNSLTRDKCRAAIQAAFATWKPYVPFDFVEVNDSSGADVQICWIQAADIDYTMASNCSAHSDWPQPGCVICSKKLPLHFNEQSCVFRIGKANGMYDLQTVAVHEVGHLIGLMHSRVSSAIMYSNVEPNTLKRNLDPDDIQGVQSLYPPKSTTTPSTQP